MGDRHRVHGRFYPDSTAGRGVGAFLIVSMWGLAVVARRTHDTERLVRENHQMLRRLLEPRGEDPGSRTGTTTAHHGQEPA